MKTITVHYFAAFREHAGIGEESLTTSAETVADVFVETRHRHGSSDEPGRCKVAINDVLADWSSEVVDGDTVLLFPPVAGG